MKASGTILQRAPTSARQTRGTNRTCSSRQYRLSQIDDLHPMVAAGIFPWNPLGRNREMARQLMAQLRLDIFRPGRGRGRLVDRDNAVGEERILARFPARADHNHRNREVKRRQPPRRAAGQGVHEQCGRLEKLETGLDIHRDDVRRENMAGQIHVGLQLPHRDAVPGGFENGGDPGQHVE
jgi:hypothetical protein